MVHLSNSIGSFNKPAAPSFLPRGGLQHFLLTTLASQGRESLNCALGCGCSLSEPRSPLGAPPYSQMPEPGDLQELDFWEQGRRRPLRHHPAQALRLRKWVWCTHVLSYPLLLRRALWDNQPQRLVTSGNLRALILSHPRSNWSPSYSLNPLKGCC